MAALALHKHDRTYLAKTRGALVSVVHVYQLTTLVVLVQVAATSQGQRSIACLRTRQLTGVVFTAQTTVTRGSHWIQAVGHQRWTLTPAVNFAVL